MARYFSRKGNGRRGGGGKGSTYMRANNESLSNLRLYTDDQLDKGESGSVPSGDYTNNSFARFLLNAGLASPVVDTGVAPPSLKGIKVSKSIKIRFVAVGWSAGSATSTNAGGVTLEFAFDGNSFNISDRSIKPVRTRIPQKNYVLTQWINVPAGQYNLTDTISGSLGNLVWGQKLFTCDGVINFVDIAVRY